MTSETSRATGGIAAGDLRVVRPADRVLDQASGGMRREAAVSRALVGAERIWLGYGELDPVDISASHHHGEAESTIYLISVHARFVTEGGTHDAEAGGGGWVPPHGV